MRSSDALADLYAALAAARPEFLPIKKSGVAKITNRQDYPYATLDDVFAAIDGSLGAHGLAIIGGVEYSETGHLLVITRLSHSSGQWVENALDMGEPKTPQDMGSLLTYGRRYGVLLTVGVHPADEDDDGGEAGTQPLPKATYHPTPAPTRAPTHDTTTTGRGTKPSAEAITDLVKRLRAMQDQASFDQMMLAVMNIPLSQATDTRLRFSMTWTHYDVLQGYLAPTTATAASDASTIETEDVPDVDGVDPRVSEGQETPSESPQAETSDLAESTKSHETAASSPADEKALLDDFPADVHYDAQGYAFPAFVKRWRERCTAHGVSHMELTRLLLGDAKGGWTEANLRTAWHLGGPAGADDLEALRAQRAAVTASDAS